MGTIPSQVGVLLHMQALPSPPHLAPAQQISMLTAEWHLCYPESQCQSRLLQLLRRTRASTLILDQPSLGGFHLITSWSFASRLPATRESDIGRLPLASKGRGCCRASHSSAQYFRRKPMELSTDSLASSCIRLFRTCQVLHSNKSSFAPSSIIHEHMVKHIVDNNFI